MECEKQHQLYENLFSVQKLLRTFPFKKKTIKEKNLDSIYFL